MLLVALERVSSMAEAYVLIRTAQAQREGVYAALRKDVGGVGLPYLERVDPLCGQYDLVCIVAAQDFTALGKYVDQHIRAAAGVIDALVCIVLQPEQASA